jgi:alkyl sulfatase BDS1-like metallo-beta-lactamase superfamily hydrolase
MTEDALAATVRLPEHLASDPDLGEYYGKVSWAVRSIFNGYLGWYDGNPANLSPLSRKEEALRIAALAGGAEILLETAKSALANGDVQWASQLSDYLLALNEGNNEAKNIKADALTIQARNSSNALARNYYLTIANQLRQEAGSE